MKYFDSVLILFICLFRVALSFRVINETYEINDKNKHFLSNIVRVLRIYNSIYLLWFKQVIQHKNLSVIIIYKTLKNVYYEKSK